MSSRIPVIYPTRLTRAGRRLAELLEENGKPVLTQFDFFQIVRKMYRDHGDRKLYLRSDAPAKDDYIRIVADLKKTAVVAADRDYGKRVIRVLAVSDLPAEDIVCLVDPTCYVSHLSAMQRWGLTDRRPDALALTRPDRRTATKRIQNYMRKALGEDETTPLPLRIVGHPEHVRRRAVKVHESKAAGAFLKNRGSEFRLSTIGQTFLDMLQRPDLCGGMSHILDVWEEQAENHLDDIVSTVNSCESSIVKSRAGYILEERLGLRHSTIESWKKFCQRGSSRKLDPTEAYAPTFSETWMISLNV
ncbi:MAG: hypothetical protein OXG10_02725 [Candidatus Dadabacteria bacterium]|nr:hypothetical protein [Candidatus Dadabacteria bacterium]